MPRDLKPKWPRFTARAVCRPDGRASPTMAATRAGPIRRLATSQTPRLFILHPFRWFEKNGCIGVTARLFELLGSSRCGRMCGLTCVAVIGARASRADTAGAREPVDA